MKRKIVHIATVPQQNTLSNIVALCDDGTLWQAQLPGNYPGFGITWNQVGGIPQPPAEPSGPFGPPGAAPPDFELPSTNVPTEREKIVRELLADDIADLKTMPARVRDLDALERLISQKGLEVLRPSGLWFAGVHHGRKNP